MCPMPRKSRPLRVSCFDAVIAKGRSSSAPSDRGFADSAGMDSFGANLYLYPA